MALQNDPRMFTGGYERLDTRPHVQLYAQLKQREQARNDAFDEYMRNLNLKINPAGMRNQERQAFEEKLRNWQQSGIQNRELIRNPRKDMGKAQMEFQAGYQDLLNLAAESKTAAEGLKPFIEVATDPKKYNLLNKDRAMGAVQSHDQPILIKDETGQYVRNPNFKPFTPSELEFREEDFDVPKYLKSLDYIKPTDTAEEIVSTDPKTMMRKVRKTSKFKPEDYDKLASIGVQTYYSDPSMKQLVDQMYNDPNNKEVLKLNELYKNKFGTDIQSEGDLAAAMTIAGKETTEQEEKMQPDTFAQGMARAKYTQDRIDARQRRQQDFTLARDSYNEKKNAKIVDEYVQSQYDDPAAQKGWVTHEGKKFEGKFIKAPKFLVDKYSINRGTKDKPEWDDPRFFISDDGRYVFPVYKKEERPTGNFGVAPETKPINMADYKIEISNDWIKNNRTANELADQFDVEGEEDVSTSSTNIQRGGTVSSDRQSVPNYSRQDLKNAGWTDSQIKQAVQAGKIKVN